MVSQSWANIGSVRGRRGWAAGWRERGEARTQADKDLKLLMFGKIDRVPRGYAATREREPVRMESQNQFIPSRSRPERAGDCDQRPLEGCCGKADVHMLGCSWAPGWWMPGRSASKQDVEHRQMTFMDKDARED